MPVVGKRRSLTIVLPFHITVSPRNKSVCAFTDLNVHPIHQRYEAVRDCELDFLFEHWDKLKTSDKLTDTIASVARGELPYATDILTAIITH